MKLKPGTHVWYRRESYDVLAKKPETHIIEVVIVAPAEGTDFSEADWIVCYPEDYPIADLRSRSTQKHWGIMGKYIIETRP